MSHAGGHRLHYVHHVRRTPPLLYVTHARRRFPAPNLDTGIIDPWGPWLLWKRLVIEFSRWLSTDPADRVRAIGCEFQTHNAVGNL